jgi:topoisomerase-4 subunit B
LKATVFNGRAKLEVSRFKGLGEMMPAQLKETTMAPSKRTLLRVEITGRTGDLNGLDLEADEAAAADIVEQLMGNKPEARFRFIQERAAFAEPDALDI